MKPLWNNYQRPDKPAETQDPRLPKLPDGWRWAKYIRSIDGRACLSVELRYSSGRWQMMQYSLKPSLDAAIAELQEFAERTTRQDAQRKSYEQQIDALLRGQQ